MRDNYNRVKRPFRSATKTLDSKCKSNTTKLDYGIILSMLENFTNNKYPLVSKKEGKSRRLLFLVLATYFFFFLILGVYEGKGRKEL